MTPQQQAAPRRPDSATITQKVQLTLKLWMLEVARSALDRELLHLTSTVSSWWHRVRISSSVVIVAGGFVRSQSHAVRPLAHLRRLTPPRSLHMLV